MPGVITNRRQDASGSYLVQRYGPIIHGSGPPLDFIGHIGNIYIDDTAQQLYMKRAPAGRNAWGTFIFTLPMAISGKVNWYGMEPPANNLGSNGDFYLSWESSDYSVFPSLIGPKVNNVWPTTSEGVPILFTLSTLFAEVGIGSELAVSTPVIATPIVVIGIGSEAQGFNFIPASVTPIGVATSGAPLSGWTLNPTGV
jgi:hypothetical protein